MASSLRIAISPTTAGELDHPQIDDLATYFRNSLSEGMAGATLDWPVTGIVIFPRIMDETIAKFPDGYTFKRGEKAIFVGRNIDFFVWNKASPDERVGLFASALKDALDLVPRKYLPEENRIVIRSIIDYAETAGLAYSGEPAMPPKIPS
jgi:hypothetical protein